MPDIDEAGREEPYIPKPLADAPDNKLWRVVQAAEQRRLVLYVGAGLSIGAPSCGPTGADVARRLQHKAAEMLNVGIDVLQDATLEEIAEEVAAGAPDRLDELRETAAFAFNFRGMEPNTGHDLVALLLREGVAQVISVNWDCGIENAGLRAAMRIAGVATSAQRLQLVQELPLYKVHGCATQPHTLALTQAEVDRPQRWAVADVQSALAGGVVVFVGLGTVGLYVSEPISELPSVWAANNASIRVVDPKLRPVWRDALGDYAEEAYIPMTAEAFLDDLLRAFLGRALDAVDRAVDVLSAEQEPWAPDMSAGCQRLRAAFARVSGESLLRWWRDGVAATRAGTPFVTELPGQRALMSVGLLAGRDPEPLETRGVRGRLTVSTPHQYFEIVSHPGEHVRRVEDITRNRLKRRREEGVYADDRMITVVVSDAFGQFPAPDAPTDIGASDEASSDIAMGVSATRIRLIPDEVGVRGTLVP